MSHGRDTERFDAPKDGSFDDMYRFVKSEFEASREQRKQVVKEVNELKERIDELYIILIGDGKETPGIVHHVRNLREAHETRTKWVLGLGCAVGAAWFKMIAEWMSRTK